MTRTRRTARLVGAALSLALVGGLAACGGSEDEASADTSTSLLPEAEGTTQYPLEIETWLGSSTLEERPERVAVLGYSSNLDSLEAIGVTPVYYGGRDVNETYAYNDPEYLESIEVKDMDEFEPKPEAIAAAKPDLIVSTGILYEKAQFDKLAAIAPVLDLPEDPGNGDQADWRADQRMVGEALDLSAAADEAVTRADEAIAAVRDAHPEFAGKTAAIAFDYGPEWDGISYYTVAGGPAEGLLLDLGFEPHPSAKDFVKDEGVSDENQAKLDADALVMIYNTDEDRENREKQPLFAAIPAVQDGRYESLTYAPDANGSTPMTTSTGDEAQNAVWVLRRGASALALPWAAEVVADQWLGSIDLS